MDIPTWITPALVLAATVWIVREVRSLGERLAHLEGRIVRWQDLTADRNELCMRTKPSASAR